MLGGRLGGCAGVGGGKPRFAACRVSCGLPRFLRPLGRSQRLRGWGAGRWGACRVLQPVAFLAAFGPLATLAPCGRLGRAVHAALCSMPRFLRPWAARNACGKGRWGVRGMPRFATCRVSCGLRAARNACFLCCGTGIWGAAPNPGKGLRPLHPALLSPYRTTRFLSLLISSVTPSGGSPNVALSVLLPPSHVSCIAISLASIRQPSSATVTTSPTS